MTTQLVQLSIPPLNLGSLQSSVTRGHYWRNPDKWIEDKLDGFTWSKQKEIAFSVRDNRRTAVQSCHGPGKSWIASAIVCCFIDNHKPGEAIAITSAPTGEQVRAILWKEINRAHSKGNLFGRMNQTEWWARMPTGHEEMIAFGRKPADHTPGGFSGIHGKKVLVVLDEASWIHRNIWDSIDSLLANEDSRILAIGNPEDPTSEFFDVCKPGSGWNVIKISAFDTPNFTGEYVPEEVGRSLISPLWQQEKLKKWGIDNPLYIAKILGEFPMITEDTLIQIPWIRAAQYRTLKPTLPIEFGVDVAGGGGNRSIIAVRKGNVVRLRPPIRLRNTMYTLEKVIRAIKEEEPTRIKVDYIGIGQGIVDRAEQITNNRSDGWRCTKDVVGINVGLPSKNDKEYKNVRAHGYWNLREKFEEGSIDIPDNDDLLAQLSDIRYRPSDGKILIESKKDMRKRGRSSPDEADAVMLSMLDEGIIGKGKITSVLWGKKGRRRD